MKHLLKLIFFLCLPWFGGIALAEDKPNVVFIFVDDQGYYDLGCYGAAEVRTPRIDGLAAKGVRFVRKLRGMAVIFQEEMRRDARPAGEVTLPKTQNR